MQMRGCVKRHTVGCTDDLSVAHHPVDQQPQIAHSPVAAGHVQQAGVGPGAVGGIRTRRTGLLTVTERPPGNRNLIFFFFS